MENAMSEVRVLLVDDHALVRAGIRKLLENIAGIRSLPKPTTVRRSSSSSARTAPTSC